MGEPRLTASDEQNRYHDLIVYLSESETKFERREKGLQRNCYSTGVHIYCWQSRSRNELILPVVLRLTFAKHVSFFV